MKDFEKLGVFYLGRVSDPAGKTLGEPVLYDSRDLVTHALCVGMTGSGKTGLGLSHHRGGRHRRRADHRDRPQGGPVEPAADVPAARPGRLPPMDRRGRGAPGGPDP